MTDSKDRLTVSIFNLGRSLRKSFEKDSPQKTPFSMLQLHALIHIKQKGSPTMSEIAQQFGVTLPTATKLIERLVNSELIKRVSDQKDRRVVRMSLTKRGQLAVDQMKVKRDRRTKQILSLLSESDINHLQKIVDRLLLKLEEKQDA